MTTSRNWVFTINNPVTGDLFISTRQLKFVVAELECVSTIHYQGYIELKTPRNLTTVKSIFSSHNPAPHLEVRRGNRSQAIQYALKDCQEELYSLTRSYDAYTSLEQISDLITFSSIQSQLPGLILFGFSGALSELARLGETKQTVKQRLEVLQKRIQNGAFEKDIADEDFELWLKYGKQFNRYALLCSKPREEKTKLSVVQGPTGSGKSYYCRERFPGAYWKPRNQWWDGYAGQDAIIIDEFYGWLPYDQLLRLGDSYPLSVEIKGGTINFNAKHIIITTNKHPSNWYANVYFEAFIRRVEEWIIIKERHDIRIYDNYLNTPFINI